jgi:carbon starvation protein
MIFTNFGKGNYLLGCVAVVLLILAGFVMNEGIQAINKFKTMAKTE